MSRYRSESGVALIQVGLMIVALTAFSAIVLDYGVLWVARAQAQGVADGAALAGATARLFDETGAPEVGGLTELSAQHVIGSNSIFGEPGEADVTWEPTPDACPPTAPMGARCVRVNVYRDTAHQNPLPTFSGNLFALTSQNIRATATAQLLSANWANCIKPWMVQDKFTDVNMNGIYNPGIDSYTAPGYTIPNDVTNVPFTLQAGDPTLAAGPSQYYRIDLTGGGAAAFLGNISGCADVEPTDVMTTLPGFGPAVAAAGADMIGKTVPLLLYSPAEWASLPHTSGRLDLHIVNMIGFKITRIVGRAVTGTIQAVAGTIEAGAPVLPNGGGGFVQVVALVR